MSTSSESLPGDLLDIIKSDPVKRALVLQLIAQERDGFNAYKKKQRRAPNKPTTPLKTLKRNDTFESPTALQRRRALQKLNQVTTSESSSSEFGESFPENDGPKVPFDQILTGVIAYVEVKRNNEDKSSGIKAIMKWMGATIRDTFTRDVTHVIFKDGSFTTYQKARLMKVHLVSVLWIEAIRKHSVRVPEKKYPAFGGEHCDYNVSALCSQIQKDYDDIIKDEKRRSLASLPRNSNFSLERRRRTLMTPSTSTASFQTAQKSPQNSVIFEGDEAALPVHHPKRSSFVQVSSPNLTSDDDSDCGIVDGYSTRHLREKFFQSQLNRSTVVTPDQSQRLDTAEANMSENCTITPRKAKNTRKTIHVVSDMLLTPNITAIRRAKALRRSFEENVDDTKLKRTDSDMSTNISENIMKLVQQVSLDNSISSSKRVNNETKRLTSSDKENNLSAGTANTNISSLRLSEEGKNKTKSSFNLSQLVISDTIEETPPLNAKTISSASSERGHSSEIISNGEKSSRRKTIQGKRMSAVGVDANRNNKVESSVILESAPKRKRLTSDDDFVERTPRKSTRNSLFITKSTSVISKSNTATPRNNTAKRTVSTKSSLKELNLPNIINTSSIRRSSRRSLVSSRTASYPHVSRTPSKTVTSDECDSDFTSNAQNTQIEQSTVTHVVQQSPICPNADNKSAKRRRKLFNPAEYSPTLLLSVNKDDMEREENRTTKPKTVAEELVPPKDVMIPLVAVATTGISLCSSEEEIDVVTVQKNTKPVSMGSSGEESDEVAHVTVQKNTKPKRRNLNKDKEIVFNSDDDEHKYDFDKHKKDNPSLRRSQRLSLSQKTVNYRINSMTTDSASDRLSPLPNRRSTLDFQTMSLSQRKRRVDRSRTTSIVCTRLHKDEVTEFEDIVKKLGGFYTESVVTGKTSHLVAGEAKRTINMLRAISRGCWILKRDWVARSNEQGRWLNEEDFELTEFSTAVQQCRLQRQAFGANYACEIFRDCGYIYIAKNTAPKCSDLKELVQLCKGKVTSIPRNASIAVGELLRRDEVKCVSEKWILDSIAANELKSLNSYLMEVPDPPNSPHF